MPCATCTHDPRCADVCQHSSCATGQDRRQYYYNVIACRAIHATDPDCICWHDEGTGPLANHPEHQREWRVSPSPAHAGICEPETELTEAVARAIYAQWKHWTGWVPWVDGGNSLNQDEARRLARKAIAGFRAPDVGKAQAPSPQRHSVLLKAAHDLLMKQSRSGYVLNLLEQTVFYDEADCDGHCLMEDIASELAAIAQSAPRPDLLEAGKEGK